MKTHSQEFKNQIKELGRELDSKITYTIDNEEIELGNEELNSITPHYEGNILKSVMKQLDIDSNVDIPIGIEINYQLGIKVNDVETSDYRDNYEYLNYGNYIVFSSEKQEDTGSYKIIAYDKMLYSMKDYETPKVNGVPITFPITIRNYLNAICTHLGLTFKNASDTFANYDKEIPNELYLDSNGNSLGYTFRDVYDELSQVTASTICLDENDNVEVRYITFTGDTTTVNGTSLYIDNAVKQGFLYEGVNNITQVNNDLPFELELEYLSRDDVETIDEEYLKDINVNFGEKYGPINTISFKRSADSDVISKSIPEDLPDDEKIEISISDNQILNGNNRDEYIDGILNKLYGLEYYINDYSSTGICYLDLCDRYYVKVDDKFYSCIMFNDEVDITQGLEERVYTDMPNESKTDYSKSDKTDRRINQTYLIVDKQNQRIDSVVSSVEDESERITQLSQDVNGISTTVSQQIGEQNQRISSITQNVDEINQKIQDIADITTSGESSYGRVELINVNESEPISVRIRPLSTDITKIYPSSTLYPSNDLYPQEIVLRFTNTTTNDIFEYTMPDDLLYYDGNNYDEFSLAYGDGTNKNCSITKRVGHTATNGVNQVIQERIDTYPYPTIHLTSGDYTIELLGFDNAYLYVQLMASNIYTTQFATRVELSSSISQTKDEINLEVSKKVDSNEIISSINLTSEQATINANKINIQGTLQAINNDTTTTINGNKITTGSITSSQVASDIITTNNLSAQTISANNIRGGTISGNDVNITNLNASQINAGTLSAAAINFGNGRFAVNTNGTLTSTTGSIGGWSINGTYLSYGGDGGNNGARLYRDGRIYMKNDYGWLNCGSGGAILNGNRVVISDNIGTSGQATNNSSISVRAFYGTLQLNSNVGVYANNTLLSSGSSKNMKKNIKKLTQKQKDEIYNIIKDLPMYQYDYKEEYSGQKDNYGIIIEDFENNKLGEILHVVENKEDNNVKNYSNNDLTLVNTMLIKELMNKIENYETKIEELTEEINKLKEEK